MKRVVLFALLIPLAIYTYYVKKESEENLKRFKGSIKEQKKSFRSLKRKPILRRHIIKTVKTKEPQHPKVIPTQVPEIKKVEAPIERKHSQPQTTIPFEVKGKLAIAYGDVIIGEVDDHFEHKKGQTETFYPRAWNDSKIAYAFAEDFKNKELVFQVLKYLEKETPLSFIGLEEEEDAVVFVNGDEHCYSYLGKVGGHQPVFLAPNCGFQEILHEVMHVLGFIHEHSRTDRDEYVNINWENIQDNFELQFEKVPQELMEPILDTKFDFKSIMLYQPHFFAKEKGLVTLESRSSQKIEPTQKGLSKGDLEKIRLVYGD